MRIAMNCAEDGLSCTGHPVSCCSLPGSADQKISTQERMFRSTAFQLVPRCFGNLQINVFCNRSERLRVVGSNLNSVADTVEAIVVCGNTEGIEKMTQSLVHTAHLLEDKGSGSKSAISHI